MRLIPDWPTPETTLLPEQVFAVTKQILIEPFGDEDSAIGFWTEVKCLMAICDDASKLNGPQTEANDYRLQQALLLPDVIEYLPDGYELRLAITTDSGAGTYLILTPEAIAKALL